VYWLLATVAEAALVRGDVDEAEEWYARARAVAGDRFADVATTRRQARLLLEHQRHDPARLDACLTLPRVVTFAGHMIDRAGRPTPRFPPSLETAVRDAIVAELRRLDAGFGYASAACGGDILFLEAMLARDAEVHVVLPYVASEFRAHSVDLRNGWGARFDAALKQAASVVTATEQRSPGAAATYDYANMLLEGLAAIRARQLGTPISLLALWDGRPGDGLGGTETIVRRWQALGRDVRVIDLGALLNAAGSIVVKSAAPPAPVTPAADGDKHVVAMLFADAVGFSRLTEEEVPRFVSEFLGAIGELLAVTPDRPVLRNTWGDGLYFVFKDVARAGRFALALRDVVEGIHWPDRGLPGHLGLRIALHAGPVFQCVDPVTQQPNYIGSHVSRAARMEPITPPGQVYASQSFVAIAAAYGVSDFEWDYVGRVPLAKDYGTAPMYHLRRA
jgi:class 3 adenylate cyclase